MKRFVVLFSLILCTSFLVAQSLLASTVMVTVSARMNNQTVSPKSMERVNKMVLDIEDSALNEAFNAGHIVFNIPASVHLASSTDSLPTIASLEKTASDGGAEYLITCTTECAEVQDDAPLNVSSCTIRVYSVNDSMHPRFEKIVRLNAQTKDTDIKALVFDPFHEINGRL